MQGANKTIHTKVGLDLPMSKQVRQRQVTLNEGKTLVNTKRVYGYTFGLLRLSLLPEMKQRARILPELKCLATGWLASLAETARRCSPNLVLNCLRVSPM